MRAWFTKEMIFAQACLLLAMAAGVYAMSTDQMNGARMGYFGGALGFVIAIYGWALTRSKVAPPMSISWFGRTLTDPAERLQKTKWIGWAFMVFGPVFAIIFFFVANTENAHP